VVCLPVCVPGCTYGGMPPTVCTRGVPTVVCLPMWVSQGVYNGGMPPYVGISKVCTTVVCLLITRFTVGLRIASQDHPFHCWAERRPPCTTRFTVGLGREGGYPPWYTPGYGRRGIPPCIYAPIPPFEVSLPPTGRLVSPCTHW